MKNHSDFAILRPNLSTCSNSWHTFSWDCPFNAVWRIRVKIGSVGNSTTLWIRIHTNKNRKRDSTIHHLNSLGTLLTCNYFYTGIPLFFSKNKFFSKNPYYFLKLIMSLLRSWIIHLIYLNVYQFKSMWSILFFFLIYN